MVEQLTEKQKEKTFKYREEAIKVGLSTAQRFQTKLVRELTDAHRERCGVAKATNFIVVDSPWQAIELYGKKADTITPASALYGQHDVNWLWFYKFFRDECGLVEQVKPLEFLIELCKHVNWMWMGSDTTIAVRKPVEIHTIKTRHAYTDVYGNEVAPLTDTLHNPNGMALKYRDGKGIYKLNNIDFFELDVIKLVNTPANKLNPKDILAVRNTEQRTELFKKIGIDRAFSLMDKRVLHKKIFPIGGNYELYSIDFNGSDRIYLRGICPSKGETFVEAVHPKCNTVDKALAWRQTGIVFTGDYTYDEPKQQS